MGARALIRVAVLAVMALGSFVATSSASPCDEAAPHVRSEERYIRELVREGCRRSPTFKRLVDEVEASDVIVYIESDTAMAPDLNGYMRFAGAAGTYRYLRVAIGVRTGVDRLIALLGHELQHVTEVARAVDVRDHAALAAMYRLIGGENPEGWDTEAANSVANVVRDELRRGTQ